MGNRQQREDINELWHHLEMTNFRCVQNRGRLLRKKIMHPFHFIHGFMHKSWDSCNRSLKWEHNSLHGCSSSRKRHSSCFVAAIQCGRGWSESASSFCWGLVVKLRLMNQQADQCGVHQALERKPWWSVLLFIQYRDYPTISVCQEEGFALPW